jgi:membrane dipeptidase
LTAELYRRNYTDEEVVKVIGGNILRVFEEVEEVAKQLQNGEMPSEDIIDYNFANDTCRVYN